tara:strand:+ start:745 stop:1029 length:285 start_codon:yes stop_codon:yes gene_type:complete
MLRIDIYITITAHLLLTYLAAVRDNSGNERGACKDEGYLCGGEVMHLHEEEREELHCHACSNIVEKNEDAFNKFEKHVSINIAMAFDCNYENYR